MGGGGVPFPGIVARTPVCCGALERMVRGSVRGAGNGGLQCGVDARPVGAWEALAALDARPSLACFLTGTV